MAEFQEVMRQWKRMCDIYTTDDAKTCCKGCPMEDRECGAIYESGDADFGAIGREIMSWAAEHPEPVYPTWAQYFNKIIISNGRKPLLTDAELLKVVCTPIPADIAEKLGIEAKEGTC